MFPSTNLRPTEFLNLENLRQFGGPWLALHLIRALQLDRFLDKVIPEGREHVSWDVTARILIIARLLNPSGELHIAEQWLFGHLKSPVSIGTRSARRS